MSLTETQVILAALSIIIAIAISAFGGFYAATTSIRSQIETLDKEMAVFSTVTEEKVEPWLQSNFDKIEQLQREFQTLQTNLDKLSKDIDALHRKNDIASETKSYIDLRLEEIRKESLETMKSIMNNFLFINTNTRSKN